MECGLEQGMTRDFLIVGVLVLTGSAPTGLAAPVRVEPDLCAAPADAPAYRLPEADKALDLNDWRIIVEDTTPIIEVDVDAPTGSRRVFAPFWVDPDTGAVVALARREGCEELQEDATGR